ncbi:MAG TPA: DUF1549 domain-containing protein [Pirellulales bacterium]|nr:DUF1549 domain-containing protein [Pirellulales bacterium]
MPRLKGGKAAACLIFTLALLAASRLLADDPPAGEARPAQAAKIDFAKDVLPIFEARCRDCHGPEKQKSSYRLDQRQIALAGGDFGEAAIVPGKSGASPLVAYVSGESDTVMPPEGERLSADEVAVLKAWIDQGAAWPDELSGDKPSALASHWAFQPIVRNTLPDVQHPQFPLRNAIDAFVLEKLNASGLAPSPEADRRTLIRRVYFDVIGLPPSPEEIARFVADADPRAYEKLVERLLDSPQFGERWARHWLDVVRFAESHGFEMNQPRPNAWPYRDYVIRAFNEDKPYDQFVIEQLAGDALGADEATGFLAGGPWDQVKSPDPVLTAQQRADELHDMLSTTGSAFLGLTVGCARCHNHKFDPIPQTDYYALKAALEGVTHGERPLRPADGPERERELEKLREQLAAARARLAQLQPLARGVTLVLDDTQKSNDPAAPAVEEIEPPRGIAPHAAGVGRGCADQPGGIASLPNLGKNYHWWEDVANKPVFAYAPKLAGRFRVWLSWGCGWHTHAPDVAYLLDADGDPATTADQREIARVDQRWFADGPPNPEQPSPDKPLPEKPMWSGFYDAGQHDFTPATRLLVKAGATAAPVTADAVIFETARPSSPIVERAPHLRRPVERGENSDRFEPVMARHVRFTIEASDSGIEPCLDELEVFTNEAVPRNIALASCGTRVSVSGTLAGFAIHQPQHVNDGLYGNAHSWISNERDKGWVQLDFAEPAQIERVVWSRDRDSQPRYADRLATKYEMAVSLDGENWRTVASSADRLDYHYPHRTGNIELAGGLSPNETAELETLARQRDELESQIARLSSSDRKAYAGVFVAPPKTFRLHRGDPMQPKEEVAPGGLSAFGGGWRLAVDAPEQERRLALARWIASPDNVLTSRVIANRLWHYHFGQGIAGTPSDFGVNGGQPSHPELLDWLASELVAPQADDGGPAAQPWSLKHLHRLMLRSSTYRQASRGQPEAIERDAQSRLLWRYSPRRLEAEAIRDAILAVSGKLDATMGGPGFDLFQPNANYVKVYTPKREFGPETFRRMVYQSKPRMQLDDTFGAFDCPDAGQIAPRRGSSTTPLQAFNLLNSPFIEQQAGFLAGRLAKEAGADPAAQVRRAFELAFGREASPEETAAAVLLVEQHGLGAFCRAIFNANEFVMVY